MRARQKTYNDEDLIRGCTRNDRRSQELLYRKYFPVMAAMVRRYTADEDKLLEILNMGFLKVFQKIGSFRNEGSFEGWIRRIIYHSISDYFRKQSGYLKFIVLEDSDDHEENGALDGLYYSDLLEIIESLPVRSKMVFKMYAIEGFSHKEIAEELQMSEGTSKWHLSQARAQLKDLIEQRMKSNYAV